MVVLENNNLDLHNTNNLSQYVRQIQEKFYSGIDSAGGIIYDSKNDKILIVRGPTKWSLPKGHREIGETVWDTAIREIYEETSIKVHLTDKNQFRRFLKCIYFLIIIDNGSCYRLQSNDTREVNEMSWVSIDQIDKSVCNNQLRMVIKKWKYLQQIFKHNKEILKTKYTISNGKYKYLIK
ncbi:MAG: NUDIX hydrolase [candidate division WOR-3 bacterium]